jgi:mono/diheme cytochrome c family protein
VVIHNTLWIVGHFHHMAMLNIGLLVFGAVYAFLPELTGRALYSEAMAKWHVWTTFVAGMIVYFIWLVQGLDGAPRRWAVLPSEYDTLTRVSVPFVLVLAAAQALFFWNVIQTIRGRAGAASFDERGIPLAAGAKGGASAPVAEATLILAALALAAGFAAAGYLVGRESGDGGDTVTVTDGGGTGGETGGATTDESGDAEAGAAAFASGGCGGCHTFAPAGSDGQVGPALDGTALSADEVAAIVSEGKGGMPAFGDRLSEDEIADLAAFVTSSAD